MKAILTFFLYVVITTFCTAQMQPSKTGYAPVNGLKLYYEIYGSGQPLVLIHGGLGVASMFGPSLPDLAAKRQVNFLRFSVVG